MNVLKLIILFITMSIVVNTASDIKDTLKHVNSLNIRVLYLENNQKLPNRFIYE